MDARSSPLSRLTRPCVQVGPAAVACRWRPFRMAASVSFGIILNFAALGLFAWLFKRIRDLQQGVGAMAAAMDLAKALVIKDETTKDSLTDALSDRFSPDEVTRTARATEQILAGTTPAPASASRERRRSGLTAVAPIAGRPLQCTTPC